MMITRIEALVAVTAYQVRDSNHEDVGDPIDYRAAISRAHVTGTGAYLVATGSDGLPLTREDGTEYVGYTVD